MLHVIPIMTTERRAQFHVTCTKLIVVVSIGDCMRRREEVNTLYQPGPYREYHEVLRESYRKCEYISYHY